jgi:hypothetical protein
MQARSAARPTITSAHALDRHDLRAWGRLLVNGGRYARRSSLGAISERCARGASARGGVMTAALGTAAGLIGAGIGAASNGTKGAVVGGVAGTVTGTAVVLFSAARSRGMILDAGLPLELLLDGPIAGTPGTPDIIIPGSPGTPASGDMAGIPPTPPTIIPGAPATPGYWYSCR